MTTFVLIPGAGGQARFWRRVVPELERHGHSAVAVDLPSDDDAAGLEAYADAVARAVDGRGPVTVVGQSMGGLTAPLVCRRRPVEAIVLVNAMIPRPGETGGDWWTATGQDAAQAAYWAQLGLAGEADDSAVYFHDVPDDVVAEEMAQPFGQSGRPLEDPWPLATWPDVPTRVLAGRDDRLFPLDFQRRVAAERLGLRAEEVPGGHCAALSRPRELAEALVVPR
ncbi:alpha/beta fold hydrolase [Blastococcus sp. LR1]|uniref:alpha/beta fold hydrolase n=1 Tax=Blastococcus sp. LR1 TaxID=2877000 RepID=UPI001CCC3DDB|nr:alpha/beta hydrolase [Blastococcus sp. LR1]MCA0146727.1 alpha/beta hydrolase [Blastococcus sp. LR1]